VATVHALAAAPSPEWRDAIVVALRQLVIAGRTPVPRPAAMPRPEPRRSCWRMINDHRSRSRRAPSQLGTALDGDQDRAGAIPESRRPGPVHLNGAHAEIFLPARI
jgi:hypothetical protein